MKCRGKAILAFNDRCMVYRLNILFPPIPSDTKNQQDAQNDKRPDIGQEHEEIKQVVPSILKAFFKFSIESNVAGVGFIKSEMQG